MPEADSTSSARSARVPVSVVIPCYRCAHTIERAVASVAAQTTPPMEILLVDDASGDGSLDVLRALQSRLGPEWLRIIALAENGGPSAARNAGWDAATQPYLAFLDADDSWLPRKLELQRGWMSEHPDVAMTGHPCLAAPDELQAAADDASPPRAARVRSWRQLVANRFSTSAVMLRTELPYRFEPEKRHSEDALLWNSIILDGRPVHYLDRPLTVLYKPRYGASGLSAEMEAMYRGQIDSTRRLLASGRISRPLFVALRGWLRLKYWRRRVRMRLGYGGPT